MRPLLLSAIFVSPCGAGSSVASQPVYLVAGGLPQEVVVMEPVVELRPAARDMLVLPEQEGLMGMPPALLRSEMGSSEFSEEADVETAHGRTIRRMRRCRNGVCEEHMEAGSTPSTGFPAFGHMLEEAAAARMSVDPILPFSQRLRGAVRRFEEEEEALGEGAAHLPSASHLAQGLHLGGNMTSESRSVSTETEIENGHRVSRTTKCVNGKCTTTQVTDEQEKHHSQDRTQTDMAKHAGVSPLHRKSNVTAAGTKDRPKTSPKAAGAAEVHHTNTSSKAASHDSVKHVF